MNLLKDVPVMPENTVRVYFIYNVADNDLESHLRTSGITDENLLKTLLGEKNQFDPSLALALPSLRSLWNGAQSGSNSIFLPSWVLYSPGGKAKVVLHSTTRATCGFLSDNSAIGKSSLISAFSREKLTLHFEQCSVGQRR
jgi:hypothetical protein